MRKYLLLGLFFIFMVIVLIVFTRIGKFDCMYELDGNRKPCGYLGSSSDLKTDYYIGKLSDYYFSNDDVYINLQSGFLNKARFKIPESQLSVFVKDGDLSKPRIYNSQTIKSYLDSMLGKKVEIYVTSGKRGSVILDEIALNYKDNASVQESIGLLKKHYEACDDVYAKYRTNNFTSTTECVPRTNTLYEVN